MRASATRRPDPQGTRNTAPASQSGTGQAEPGNDSRGAVAQRQLVTAVRHSPRMAAEEKRHAAIFGRPSARAAETPPQWMAAAVPPPQTTVQLRPGPGDGSATAHAEAAAPSHGTGLPEALRTGLESLSGLDLSGVRVHTDSAAPAQLQALAFARGSEIHLGPGQEKHLPHEAWHVVQQAQGRVQSPPQCRPGIPINDDRGLEQEADRMGAKAMQSAALVTESSIPSRTPKQTSISNGPVQRKIGFEFEMDSIRTRHTNSYYLSPSKVWEQDNAGDRIMRKNGYDVTADIAAGYSRIEFVTDAFDEKTQLGELKTIILSIIADIKDIQRVSAANQRGYLAGVPYTGAGRAGYFAGDGWVGIDKIPRLGGSWRHQMEYAPTQGGQLAGQLQMTAGFDLSALQKLMSGEALGYHGDWNPDWNQGPMQFLTNYAQYVRAPSKLYQSALTAVNSVNLCSGAKRAANIYASILAVMAQLPINGRGGTYDFGNIIAKTDYAQLLMMAEKDTRIHVDPVRFTNALLRVVNDHVDGAPVTADSTIFPATPADPIDLGKVTIKEWVKNALPAKMQDKKLVSGNDKMTQQHYPGTQQEKTAMRTFGPYGKKTDPGEKAIFELRSFLMSPVTDLETLVDTLANIMQAIQK